MVKVKKDKPAKGDDGTAALRLAITLRQLTVSECLVAENIILAYLKKQNRPYSANDVFTNLHGAVGKAQVPKLLTSLAERGEITFKQFNKTVVYVAKQDDEGCPSPEELEQMEIEMAQLKEEISQLKDNTKDLQTQLTGLTSTLKETDLEKRLVELDEENAELERRLVILREGGKLINEADRRRVEADLLNTKKLWATRKRMFKDVFSAITENMPQKPAEFMEELGIETDETVGVQMDQVLQGLV